MSSANYMHVEPNSWFYTDLNQLLTNIKYQPQILTKEYLLVGLNNSLKQGFEFKKVNEGNGSTSLRINNIKELIEIINNSSNSYLLNVLENVIINTLNAGYNLSNGLKLWRFEVYKRIDGERDYQDMRWNTNLREGDVPDQEKPPAEWINYMEYHVSKAKDEIYHLNKDAALAEIRKVAALAVRALEIHGCPEREFPKEDSKPLMVNDGTGNSVNWKTTTSVASGGNTTITYKQVPSTPTGCGCGDDCDCKKDKK